MNGNFLITKQHVVELWNGRITQKDKTLQLILILDYIFDWARDIYRKTIIYQLRILADLDTASLAGDSDVFSTYNPVDSWIDRLESEAGPDSALQQISSSSVPEILKDLDCSMGVIRDARFFQARFYGLHITRDNLEEFLQTESTSSKLQKLARGLQRFLKDAMRVDEATLNKLETLWTGEDRPGAILTQPSQVFLVKISMTAYLTSSWEQVVELTYVAIEEAAVDALKKRADMVRGWCLYPSKLPFVREEELLRILTELRRSSSQRDILFAAICSRCLVVGSSSGLARKEMGGSSHNATEDMDLAPVFAVSQDDSAAVRNIVLSIYNRCKVGMRQPSQDFLRLSFCNDEQSTEMKTSYWQDAAGEADGLDHITDDENIVCLRHTFTDKICLYLLDGPDDYGNPPDQLSLKLNLLRQYYPTIQDTSSRRAQYWNETAKISRRHSDKAFDTFVRHLGEKSSRLYIDDTGLTAAIETPKATSVADDTEGAESSVSTDSDNVLPPGRDHQKPPLRKRSLSKIKERFASMIFHELSYLSKMMHAARVSVQSAGPAVIVESSEEGSHDEGCSGETPGSSTTSSNDDFPSSKRPRDIPQEEEEQLSDQPTLKRLFTRPPEARFEGDRLDDKTVKALLLAGCFGGDKMPMEEAASSS